LPEYVHSPFNSLVLTPATNRLLVTVTLSPNRTASRRRERAPESRLRRRRTEERRFGVWAAELPDTKPRRTPIKRALPVSSMAAFLQPAYATFKALFTRCIFEYRDLLMVVLRLCSCVLFFEWGRCVVGGKMLLF